jgi:arginase
MDRPITVLGVPMDLGSDRRGVDMGPSAIRYAGLTSELHRLGYDCRDGGDIGVPRPEESDHESGEPVEGRTKFLDAIADVCSRLADEVAAIVEAGSFPLVPGGDHSIAVGTVAGVARDRQTGVIWFDAHGDFNTPATTPSGNVHGMPLAAILGEGSFAGSDWADVATVSAENVALVGLRSLDDAEKETIRDSEVTAYTMHDIDRRGLTEVVGEAVEVATDGTEALHVSLDLDWLDPGEAPGVGTPVRGGVSYREAHAAMERLDDASVPLAGLELVEVNPILDEHNRTAELAAELAASALGKRIL